MINIRLVHEEIQEKLFMNFWMLLPRENASFHHCA